MRYRFLPPPSPDAWRTLQVHELARDYPELLPGLWREGVMGGGAAGAMTLQDAVGANEGTLEALRAVVAWRA